MTKLRTAVAGVGRMAEVCHLPILAELPQVELVAFCDTDQGNLAARGDEYGIQRRYDDHHDLLENEELDALCLFVPPFAHTDAEIIAAERGIHVFVEKPQALDMAKAHEINAAIEKSGVISAVGFNERYRQSADAAQERVAGQPFVQALIHRLHGSTAAAYWWMVEELSGGAFVENTIHAVDLLRYLGGEPVAVSAKIVDRPEKTQELDIPLSHCVTYTLAGGGVANVTTCTALEGHGHSQFLLIAGGSLFDLSGAKLCINGEQVVQDEGDRADHAAKFATFFEAIVNDDPGLVRCDYAEGLKSLAAVLGAVDSARNDAVEVDLTQPPYVV